METLWADILSGCVAHAVNRASEIGMEPDHAGAFETLLMNAIAPDTVDMAQLPTLEDVPDRFDRHDPNSAIWGVIGKDPRTGDLTTCNALFERVSIWLAGQPH